MDSLGWVVPLMEQSSKYEAVDLLPNYNQMRGMEERASFREAVCAILTHSQNPGTIKKFVFAVAAQETLSTIDSIRDAVEQLKHKDFVGTQDDRESVAYAIAVFEGMNLPARNRVRV